ncbi:c-type cytochrome [Elizabethkingia bruuniana]|uniref:Methylamine utilization protein MauG n=1 Tax=Elizabethkingia bruuniana TaxID=1756149 RepID=A0A7T7V098_9FLAO|nr:cytochrome c peroxidase [Elizabethkingia bruuniana]KGO11747.1 cytochrome C peroxidase [Elizabethkingia miricola]AQX85803.1 cytochrome-c peroxidase [Elizabethkingia bruuniana]KUY22906.1 cytochrome C peroxidase [Elizabethkingia bruuniana]OPB68649.1 cytochrome-c peroxidase [Elizabethkingia bruuniana]QDZ61862.1 c-type cytochrome [Elizabethkingia bruuniana]
MKDRYLAIIAVVAVGLMLGYRPNDPMAYTVDELRDLYSGGDKSKWPKPHLFAEAEEHFQDIGPLADMQYPADNPYSEDKMELGKTLFLDPRLSKSGQIACASCHNPELGWADGNRVSFGHDRQNGTRNAPTLLNIGFAKTFFWDGRSATLEEQVKAPIENPVEMNLHMSLATKNIRKIKGYKPYFEKAFGTTEITEDRIAKAIATFERSLISPPSRFDKFVSGKRNALTDAEVKGLHLFRTKANCINCHNTPYFSDQKFHNLGLTYYGRKYEDLGRYLVTLRNEDVGKFKTPTLREVSENKPYMHNGLFPELANIVMMYNAGMGRETPRGDQVNDPKFPHKSGMVEKLNMTDEEVFDVVAFLKTLNSYKYKMRAPELPK